MDTTNPLRLRPEGLVHSPAFTHVAVIPPGATTVLVGGQNAVDTTGALVGEGDVAAQVDRCLDNLDTALAAAGASLADVVQWRIATLDDVDLTAAFSVFQRRWDPAVEPPLISVLRVRGLAVPGALVEMDAVAVAPSAVEV